jgi:hypothetical protein
VQVSPSFRHRFFFRRCFFLAVVSSTIPKAARRLTPEVDSSPVMAWRRVMGRAGVAETVRDEQIMVSLLAASKKGMWL